VGGSYEIVCDGCGYRDVFRFGLGFLYSDEMLFSVSRKNELLERLVVTKSNYDMIKDLLENHHAMPLHDYGHDIYRCRHCGTFHEGFYIRLDYEDDYFEPSYECPECGLELDRTEFEESDICSRWHLDMLHGKYPCPMCGKYSLKRSFDFHS